MRIDIFNRAYFVAGILYAFSVVNLLFMHYYISLICGAEDPLTFVEYLENFGGCLLDVCILFLLMMLIVRGNIKRSLLGCYIVMLLWSFSNVLYSRFFGQYIPFSAIGQLGSVADGFMIRCMLGGLSVTDFFYIVSPVAFAVYYRRSSSVSVSRMKMVAVIVLLPVFVFAVDLFANIPYCFSRSDTRNVAYYKFRIFKRYKKQNVIAPVWTNFIRGTVRMFVPELYMSLSDRVLLPDEILRIEKEYENHDCRIGNLSHDRPDIDNIIFIIVESYLSVTSDMRVNGVEVTPYLNRLKHSENVYYNGRVNADMTIGESSDGQFIYMTGLLPLRNNITISAAGRIVLPGLPQVLRAYNAKIRSKMIVPTAPTLWNQREMCAVYGFDRLYSVNDFHGGHGGTLSDEEVFELVASTDKAEKSPFMSVVLTMSMHEPYDMMIETDEIISDSSFPEKYNNYLTACHYTDKCIGKYLEWLKDNGLYDKSLIVIAADHYAHPELLDMKDKVSKDLPLYIINGGIDTGKAWAGACHQLDVYTTILDVLGIDGRWRGLGHTLLSTDYKESVDNDKFEISDMIINGDYFNTGK